MTCLEMHLRGFQVCNGHLPEPEPDPVASVSRPQLKVHPYKLIVGTLLYALFVSSANRGRRVLLLGLLTLCVLGVYFFKEVTGGVGKLFQFFFQNRASLAASLLKKRLVVPKLQDAQSLSTCLKRHIL